MYTQTKNTIKKLRKIYDFDKEEIREILDNIEGEGSDFEIADYRFINMDDIDKIQQEELESDTYMLGCFSSWFIADILNIPVDSVEKIQKSEGFEALGELMKQHIEKVQEEYVSADGYGHHFNCYDGSEKCIGNYYIFRTN